MARDLASRLVVGLSGAVLTADEAAWLGHYQPAGVILFSRNCESFGQLRRLCRHLSELVPGLEIMADHEGGPVSQLARALGRPPVAWSLGQIDDVDLTARVHAETGRRLQAAGVTRVLAPVADVLTEMRNPVIGARAFGNDSALVERHLVAAVGGLLESGVAVCLKHWPGHGGTDVDSHLAEVAAGEGAIAAPFAAGLAAGADAIMVGHLATGGASAEPATLDAPFLADSVNQLQVASGCRARLIADDITMGSLRAAMSGRAIDPGDGLVSGMVDPSCLPREWIAALLDAGCDQLLVRGLPLGAFPAPADSPERAAPASHMGALPQFAEESYHEARQRSWALAGRCFADSGAALLWWDLTIGDRWQVAGGDQGTAQEQLSPLLNSRFAKLCDWRLASPEAGGISRLLVTSHRPLSDPGQRDGRLATEGVCLVMGHPSLADELTRYLGAGWTVGAISDVSPVDLFATG